MAIVHESCSYVLNSYYDILHIGDNGFDDDERDRSRHTTKSLLLEQIWNYEQATTLWENPELMAVQICDHGGGHPSLFFVLSYKRVAGQAAPYGRCLSSSGHCISNSEVNFPAETYIGFDNEPV